jgi:hypothetical protein
MRPRTAPRASATFVPSGATAGPGARKVSIPDGVSATTVPTTVDAGRADSRAK